MSVAEGSARPRDGAGLRVGIARRAGALRATLLTRRNGLRLLSLVVVFSAWQAWGSANPYFASYPTAIWTAATEVFWPTVYPAFVTTLTALGVGMAIAAPIGMAVGFAMGRVRLFDVALTPYIYAIYATPRIALIPILVLWLGIAFELRVTIVALGAVFPIIVNTYTGSKNSDPELIDVGRVFTASDWQVLRTVVIPSAAPYVFAGIRIGLGRGVSGVIVAEMTSSLTGIGRLLISYAKYLQTANLFVGIMALGLFALVLYSVLARLQRRMTPWADLEQSR